MTLFASGSFYMSCVVKEVCCVGRSVLDSEWFVLVPSLHIIRESDPTLKLGHVKKLLGPSIASAKLS